MILTLRTDKPESEIGLYDGETQLAYLTWQAHRQLAETIHQKIRDLLHDQDKDWKDLSGLVVYKGPGSFTGLRIGMSVANALAQGFDIPVVATGGNDWAMQGIESLGSHPRRTPVTPEYGQPANITQPRK